MSYFDVNIQKQWNSTAQSFVWDSGFKNKCPKLVLFKTIYFIDEYLQNAECVLVCTSKPLKRGTLPCGSCPEICFRPVLMLWKVESVAQSESKTGFGWAGDRLDHIVGFLIYIPGIAQPNQNF